MKNKRAAFEMSITTVVIIVIAIIMLVMGIVLTQKIMCGAMNIADTTLEGAEGEIAKLFGGGTDENIRCQGQTGKPITLPPGKTSVVGCGILYGHYIERLKWEFDVDVGRSALFDEKDVKSWMELGETGTKKGIAANAQRNFGVTFVVPKGTNEGVFHLIPSVSIDGGEWDEQDRITVEVKNPGWVANTIC